MAFAICRHINRVFNIDKHQQTVVCPHCGEMVYPKATDEGVIPGHHDWVYWCPECEGALTQSDAN